MGNNFGRQVTQAFVATRGLWPWPMTEGCVGREATSVLRVGIRELDPDRPFFQQASGDGLLGALTAGRIDNTGQCRPSPGVLGGHSDRVLCPLQGSDQAVEREVRVPLVVGTPGVPPCP